LVIALPAPRNKLIPWPGARINIRFVVEKPRDNLIVHFWSLNKVIARLFFFSIFDLTVYRRLCWLPSSCKSL
jgi:hypothetical protein